MENEENNVIEETTAAEAAEETATVPEYSEALNDLKTEYEARLAAVKKNYQSRIEERDKVIKQLLTGDGKTATAPENKIVDEINKRRDYKKW